jgi:hypothetical protein
MAALIYVIYLIWPPRPSCVVLIGAGYEENLAVPHNVYGWKGLTDFVTLAKSGKSRWLRSGLFTLKHEEPVELRGGVAWDKDLDSVKEKAVIVFLALHGGADEEGCYFLYHDSDLSEGPKSRLRLDDVLDRLTKLEKKKIVLILDATQVPANWQLGMLHNDFARKLHKASDRIQQIPDLVVLSASDIDQRSWVSEEWRQTVFTHYILEGLSGAADEAETGNHDGRVNALELHQYVAAKVQQWARDNRDALQTPVLLPVGGEERARSIELVAVTPKEQRPVVEEAPAFRVPPELTTAWQTFHDLQEEVPPPASYAPHLWRQYQETLLRYEQLVRAGDTRKITDVSGMLRGLKDDIDKARAVDRPSAQYALPLPAALGKTFALRPDKDVKGQFEQLWRAKEELRRQTWDQMEKAAADQSRELRLQLCGLLLDRAVEDPQQNLRKAADLLHLLCGKGNERPAELHFLAMLQGADNLAPEPNRPPAELLATALKIRVLAENVALAVPLGNEDYRPRQQPRKHPYSEQVFPWIQDKVLRADEKRQQGQDFLFASDKDSWGKARQLLAEAEQLYRSAQEDADAVRDALQTRDEVFAALPYYSQWMAGCRLPDDKRELDIEEKRLGDIEELWRSIHLLAQLLEKPQPERIQKEWQDQDRLMPGLRSQAKTVHDAFGKIQKDFEERCEKLSTESANLQKVWRDSEEALRVPGLKPQLRKELLEKQRRISYRFLHETDTKAKGVTQEETSNLARDSGKRQGAQALAVLGQSWFDDQVAKTRLRYSEAKTVLDNLRVDPQWPATLGRTGEEIGLRWRGLPTEIAQRVEQSRTWGPVDKMAEDLLRAERLARQVDGATARTLSNKSVNPVEGMRKVRTHNLLLWLADRTQNDHWFAEDPEQTAEPYYRFVGLHYVQDALALVEGKNDPLAPAQRKERAQPADRMKLLLNRPGEVLGVNQRDVDVATEEKIPAKVPITYPLRLADKDGIKGWVPAGHPVVWLETGKFLEPVAKPRQVLEVKNETVPGSVSFDDVAVKKVDPYPKVPTKNEEKVALRGFYRGQRIGAKTQLVLHRVPETVVYHHPPEDRDTGIIVRASPGVHQQFAASNGAVAIVLDASGSMLEPSDKLLREEKLRWDRQVPCKYHDATKALREVLKGLPPGTHVSVFVFSHVKGPHNEFGFAQNKQPTDVDEWIDRVWDPAPWDPDKQLDALMDKVEDKVPYNYTPLVRAMWKAKETGFPKNISGFKTLLVLTDGMDTEFKNDKDHKFDNKLNPDGKLTIPEFLRQEFATSGVRINMIHFKVDPKEEEEAKRQFKRVIEEDLPLKGKLYTANDAKQLIYYLKKSLTQSLTFRVEDYNGKPAVATMPEEGWLVGQTTAVDPAAIRLEPGSYVVKVPTQKLLKQAIELAKGQYLRVTLTDDGEGFEVELFRDDYERRPHHTFRRDNGEQWLLTAPQNQFKEREGELEMMLTMEAIDKRVRRSDTLRHPALRTWLEVTPQGADSGAPVALRWGALAGYEAPAWGINGAGWPARGGPAVPAVSSWWIWGPEPPRLRTLDRHSVVGFRKAFVGADGRVDLGDPSGPAQIESVDVEIRQMEVAPGKYSEQSCLVVRASFPKRQAGQPDNAIWVEPEGLKTSDLGQEHRFYFAAGKYTGIFWPVTEAEAERALTALRVIGLEKFKRESKKIELPMKDTDQPSVRSRRPAPVSQR